MKHFFNLLNGKISKIDGSPFEVVSPTNQEVIGVGHIISKQKISEVFENSKHQGINSIDLIGLRKLAEYIEQKKDEFVRQIVLETGFTKQDSLDIVEGSIELVAYFSNYINDTSPTTTEAKFSYSHPVARKLKIISLPYGTIAVMTPQNAPLILELTVILNALAAGNSVVLRPSSQCVGTVTLLIEALLKTFPPKVLKYISIISCKATDFLELSYSKANLIHYIGGSTHGRRIINEALAHNVKPLVDGEGNSTIVIDKTASLDEAVAATSNGIVRCNGELCSTVRNIIVEETIYDDFCKKLVEALTDIKIGNPSTDMVDMGPLFHEKQADNIRRVAKKYALLAGDLNPHPLGSNYLKPIVCKLKNKDIGFLSEQVYGPIAGVVSYRGDGWKKWLANSPFKLNSAVFSTDKKFVNEFITISCSPRVVINHDPSIESAFEPWGGFLPSGFNNVSFWIDKYRKSIQIDTNL